MVKGKLRILHVTLYVDIGGLEKIIFEMGNFFVEQGHEIEVLCLREINHDYLKNLDGEKIPIHLIRKKNRFDLLYHYKVANFIRKRKFDVVHAHSGCFWDAAVFSLFAGVNKYIFTAHGLPIKNGIKSRLEDIIAGFRADHIIAVSAEIEQTMKQSLFLCNKKIITIINGINTDVYSAIKVENEKERLLQKYQLPLNHLRVGTVGRFAPEKNYQMLLKAFSHLLGNSNKKIALLMVGSGRMEKELKKLAIDLGIEKEVYFMGVQHKIHEILPLLDVFVLSSLTEGTSISLLEAQSCCVPAVVTDVGGNGFVIEDGKSGLLCRVDDVHAMVDCLNKFLENREFAFQCGRNGRKRIKNIFSLNVMASKYEQLYRE